MEFDKIWDRIPTVLFWFFNRPGDQWYTLYVNRLLERIIIRRKMKFQATTLCKSLKLQPLQASHQSNKYNTLVYS